MKRVEFSVAAKAARLIGRENIADVDGALIELIKNAYDADATCVLVNMQIPFPDVPSTVSLSFAAQILKEEDFKKVMAYYSEEKGSLLKKPELTLEQQTELKEIFFSYNKIVVADNGYGMTENVVSTTWMHIGTGDKESNYVSPKGRVKTGAKGIGRFALDKLSQYSVMYTKSVNSNATIRWAMDWEQFTKVKLINDVKAEMEEVELPYEHFIRNEFADCETVWKEHQWNTGTMIILSPIREPWTKRLFKKVNTNLASINPMGNADIFEVLVNNKYYREFNYRTEKVAIDKEVYDYRILAEYDGKETLRVKLLRNEVDMTVKNITVKKYGQMAIKSTDEFWKAEKLQIQGYTKEDYGKEIIKESKVQEILKDDELSKIQSVGPFQAEMYFLRNTNAAGYEIMKRVAVRKRKKLLDQFSGIKIYRDNFKVRPYGDEGAMYDWLSLGIRAQKSPAAPSHLHGRWRVEPYQMIGLVKIGRETNPELRDMANREGIVLTDTYYIFVELLQEAINEFEYDRQYIYREYGKWIKSIEDELADYAEKVKEEVRRWTQNQYKNAEEEEQQYEKETFTDEELFGTVQQLMDEADQELKSKQMQQILSSSGIVLNTFFHEFNAINTQFHVQAAQIRSRINYILHGEEYAGISAYNPYTRIDMLEKNDRLIAAFLDVVMDGLKKDSLEKREISLQKEIVNVLEKWQLMLEDKNISIGEEIFEKNTKQYNIKMAIVDIYIILNNFLLNSAWFLEQGHNAERRVWFDVFEEKENVCLTMENNGPPLDEKYRNHPDMIFEMGESSKGKDGTGLGLWAVREAVLRNQGTISVLERPTGFGLKIVLTGMVKIICIE